MTFAALITQVTQFLHAHHDYVAPLLRGGAIGLAWGIFSGVRR